MNYFGVERRVAVLNKVSPRDFDRSKVFKVEIPVQYYKVTFGVNMSRYVFHTGTYRRAIRNILKTESKTYTLYNNIYGDIIGTAVLSDNSLEHLSKFVTIMSKELL